MKVPTWGTVIGILMIVFGGCSVMNDLQAITLPEKLEEQKARLHEKRNESKSARVDSVGIQSTDSLADASNETSTKEKEDFELAEKILDLPDFTKVWIVRFGYIGVFISIIYMLGGVFLLVPKSFSITLAYTALVLSIACSGIQTVVLTSSGASAGIIALATGATQILGIIIDIILLSVIFASDKEVYTTNPSRT